MQEHVITTVAIIGGVAAAVAASWVLLKTSDVWPMKRLMSEKRTVTLEFVLLTLRQNGGLVAVNADLHRPRAWYIPKESADDIRADDMYIYVPLRDIASAMLVVGLEPQKARTALDEAGLGQLYRISLPDPLETQSP